MFCFSHKKWTVYRYKQNRQLSFLVKRDTKIVNLKVKAHEKRNSCSQNVKQIILMKKNGLNVEHFHYHIAINYDKNQHAFINQMLYQKKKVQPNYVLVWPTEKVSLKSVTSGKNESRALPLEASTIFEHGHRFFYDPITWAVINAMWLITLEIRVDKHIINMLITLIGWCHHKNKHSPKPFTSDYPELYKRQQAGGKYKCIWGLKSPPKIHLANISISDNVILNGEKNMALHVRKLVTPGAGICQNWTFLITRNLAHWFKLSKTSTSCSTNAMRLDRDYLLVQKMEDGRSVWENCLEAADRFGGSKITLQLKAESVESKEPAMTKLVLPGWELPDWTACCLRSLQIRTSWLLWASDKVLQLW